MGRERRQRQKRRGKEGEEKERGREKREIYKKVAIWCVCLSSLCVCSYGFALEETNYKDLGETVAREALSLEKNNPWATHTLGEATPPGKPAAGTSSLWSCDLTCRSCD